MRAGPRLTEGCRNHERGTATPGVPIQAFQHKDVAKIMMPDDCHGTGPRGG